MEVAGQDRDILVGRVRVRGDLVARWHLARTT
jgi:hypothetical protein